MKAIVAVSDQVMVLNRGTLLMTGPPQQVLSADPRVVEAYLGKVCRAAGFPPNAAGGTMFRDRRPSPAMDASRSSGTSTSPSGRGGRLPRRPQRRRQDDAPAGDLRHGLADRVHVVVQRGSTCAATRSSRSSTSGSPMSPRAADVPRPDRRDNLRLGGWRNNADLDRVLELFPARGTDQPGLRDDVGR